MVQGVRPKSGLDTGDEGPAGAGDIPTFKNVQKRDDFFNTNPNQLLLVTDLPVLVNQGNAVTIFIWTGEDQPVTYDPDLFIEQALNSGPGTLFLGLDGANISSGARVLNINDAYGQDGIAPFITVESSGFSGIKSYTAAAGPSVNAINADSGTNIPDGDSALELEFTSVAVTYNTKFTIIPNSSGALRIRSWADAFDGVQILVDDIFTVLAGDVGNQTTFDAKNKTAANIGDQQFVRFSGVDLDGAVQSAGEFIGLLSPFLSATVYICDLVEFDPADVLTAGANIKLTGAKFEAAAKQVIYSANYIIRNPGQASTTAETLGRVDVYQKTAISDTITDKQFTASPTDPLIEIDNTGIFSDDDIVLVEGTKFNDGLYEVKTQSGSVIFAQSIANKIEDFTNGDVVTAEETGTVTKVNVSVWRTSATGTPEHGRGSNTPIVFHQLAHASDVPIVATEEFANTDARFFGELGLPDTQGWIDTEANGGTIAVVHGDTVFGVEKDVIKYNIAASGDTAKSELALTAADWTNILTFGAAYSGTCRITEDISTQSIFSGMGFSAGNDPRPSSIRSRVGIFISENGTHTTITMDGQSAVVLDGTGGKPLVLKDAYFSWEVSINPTPDAGVNFGGAVLFVNGTLVKIGGIVSSNNAVDDEVSVANSSSTGTTTFYFAAFGVTIYEEADTKTLSTTTMAADIAQVFLPGGRRNYTVILPDGNPRKLGNKLNFVAQNVGGTLTLETENESIPQSLFNGLHDIKKIVNSVREISFVNTIDNDNVYVEDSEILNQDSLGFDPGSINYDPVKGTMNVRNAFPGSSIQVGQEIVVFVVNNTGATITDGQVVHIEGYDAVNDAMEVHLALADSVEETEVLGMATTVMIDGAVGLITKFGRVNDLDTSGFTGGEIAYLSDTVPGGITATRPAIPIQVGHIGKIDALTGFVQIDIKEMEKSIFGGFSHSADQPFTANVSKPIAFDTDEESSGIEHSTTVDNSEFTFTSGGVYQTTAEPQYTRTSGGGTDVLNVFVAKDTGSGFVNVPRTNVKFAVNTAGATLVSPLTTTFRVNAGDKIRFMAQVESANLILDAFPASGTAPNEIPATPSIIMNITRIGD